MGGLPALLVVLCAGGMCKYCFRPLAFALNPLLLLHALQKWHLGCLVFLYLVHNLPQLLLQAVIFSLLQFVCIFLLEERYVQVQTLQQMAPSPSWSHCYWTPTSLSPLLHPGRGDEAGWHQLYQLFVWRTLDVNQTFFQGTESEPQKSAGHQAHARSLVGEDDVRRWMGLG